MANNAKSQPATYTVTLTVPTGHVALVQSPEAYIAGRMKRDVVPGLAALPPASREAVEAALAARDARKAAARAEAKLAQ